MTRSGSRQTSCISAAVISIRETTNPIATPEAAQKPAADAWNLDIVGLSLPIARRCHIMASGINMVATDNAERIEH